MDKDEYKRILNRIGRGFLEAHHVDLHDQFEIVLEKLTRIEEKLENGCYCDCCDEVELDPAKIERPLNFADPELSKISAYYASGATDRLSAPVGYMEYPCIDDEECETEIDDLLDAYREGGTE